MTKQTKKVAILVTGMHRSGASALARVLNIVGCDLPKTLLDANPTNERGHWESRKVVLLNDEILASAGSSWRDWRFFNRQWYASPIADGFRRRAQETLEGEFGDSPLFVLKDPRMCRLLPFWIEALEAFNAEPRVVLPFRHPLEVAASLMQHDGIGRFNSLLLWLRHLLDAEAGSRHLKRVWVRYDSLLSEPHAAVARLGHVLDVSWPKRVSVRAQMDIDAFLSPGLRHHRFADTALLVDPDLSRWMAPSFTIFNRWAREEAHETDFGFLDRVRSIFDEAAPIFSLAIAESSESRADVPGWTLTDDQIDDVRRSGLFNEGFYCTRNPDVAVSENDPLEHYLRYGWREGRRIWPDGSFDGEFYLASYPEVGESGIAPLPYHAWVGAKRGFLPTPSRDFRGAGGLDTLAGGPDLSKLWKPRNSLLDAFGKHGSEASDVLPPHVKEVAESLLAAEGREPSISVIMPVWNREEYVCRAIESALGQSYRPFEIIVIDDGSTDTSRDVIRDRFAVEIRTGVVKLIEKPHTGVSDTRNTGLEAAAGDLIAYLDSDNVWRPDYLLVMAALFAGRSEVAAAFSAFKVNDADTGYCYTFSATGDRKLLIQENYIDINVFMHRRYVYLQNGGFDVKLSSMEDWDFILSCSRLYHPIYVPYVGSDYYLDKEKLGNISRTVDFFPSLQRIRMKNMMERIRYGVVPLKLAYVLWDWPTLLQTFVLEEIRWLVQQGQDVIVYYSVDPDRAARLDFEVDAWRVRDVTHLADLLITHGRTLCHTHFAYPATTLLTWPACRMTGIPFTFFAHTVDIFHEHNDARNRIASVARDPLCLNLFVHGEYHRAFLEEQGVPAEKIALSMQAVDLSRFEKIVRSADTSPASADGKRGVFIGRFVENKGVEVLIAAAAMLKDAPITFDVCLYGPLEETYREKLAYLALDNIVIKRGLDDAEAVSAAIAGADFVVVPGIVAAEGDREGFPTVILEAMAAGRPVIASATANVPYYLRDMVEAILVTPGDPGSLADGVRRLLAMSHERRAAMLSEGKIFLRRYVGVDRTLRTYLDVWRGHSVDIFMVTYNTEEHDDRAATFESIRRVLRHTTTPFTLTIIDNNSDPGFRRELMEFCTGKSNIRLIFLKDNLLCGPASNLALALGDASFAIYLCSKKAFIGKHGWERHLIEHMRRNSEHAMAGYRTHLPNYTLGRELVMHPDFHKFRNQEFARHNPDRVFTHVQGGAYIVRRSVIDRHGGFSEQLPHDNMDVEFSYFLESCGEKLGTIDEVASLTTRTRPTLSAIVDEHTVVAHPLNLTAAWSLLAVRRDHERARCNVCGTGWTAAVNNGEVCPHCGSTPFGRSVFQRLAHDWRAHRGGHAVLLTQDPALAGALGKEMFQVAYAGRDVRSAIEAIPNAEGEVVLAVVDADCLDESAPDGTDGRWIWSAIAANLVPNGLVLHTSAGAIPQTSPLPGESEHEPSDNAAADGRHCKAAVQQRPLSRTLHLDWRRLREFEIGTASSGPSLIHVN